MAGFSKIRFPLMQVVTAGLILTACSGENSDNMLASAKDFMAKNDSKAAVIQIKNALQKNPDIPEARFLLGKILVESGDPASGELELRKAAALKYSPDETTPLIARAMLQQGQFKKLVEEFGKVSLGAKNANASLRTTVGIALAALGNIAEAERAFSSALESVGDFAPALLAQARITAQRGNVEAAMAVVDGVIAKAPTDFDALGLKGDLHSAMGQLDQALVAYRKAVEAKPDMVAGHAALYTVLMRQGKIDEAGKAVESMKRVAPKHPRTIFFEAQYAFQKKDFPRARELTQQFLKVAPDTPAGLQLAGEIEYQAKAYLAAEHFLTRLVSRVPDNIAGRRQLSLTYLRMGQPARASAVLDPVIGKINEDSNMLALAGEVAMQNGDLAKAEQYFSKAAGLDPKNLPKRTAVALTHLAKGNEVAYGELEAIAAEDTGTRADLALIASSVRGGQYDRAFKAIDVLEKKQPDNPLVPHLRAGVLLGKKDLAGARKNLERALSLNPAYFPSAAILASMDYSEKKPDDARKRFESVLAADPKNMSAMLALAELKQRTGGTLDEVAALINKAVSAHPLDPAPRLALIELYANGKDLKRAISLAQEAVTAIPDRPQLLGILGQLQMATGESNQALATFNKMAAAEPNSPAPYLRIADAHIAAKNKESAIQALRKALEMKPDLLEAQRALMGLYLDSGSREQAIAIAREVQKQRPKEAVGFRYEGDARAANKEWAQAIAAYRAGMKVAPSVDTVIRLHTALVADKNRSEADKLATAWVKDNPKDAVFRLYLGDQALAAQDLDIAGQQYRSVLELQPNNAIALNNLAWIGLRQKNTKALEYAEKANTLLPNNPAIMDTLAMIVLDKGDTARALDLLRKAAEKSGDAPGVRLNLAKALIKSGDKAGARKELEMLAKLGDKFPAQAEVAGLLKGL